MPTPAKGYRNAAGKRIPGTTTITGRFKESDGIVYWANRLALEPLLEARSLLSQALAGNGYREAAERFLAISEDSFDYRKAALRAADAGTICHEQVECFIRKREFDASRYAPDLVVMAAPAYAAFREWAEQSKLEVTETEQQLVSERYQFGGTRDAIFISGKRAIGDWKTSNSIYPEYLCQLAAYGILDEEAGNTIDGGYHLIRFSKQEKPDDPVQFSHYYWSHLDGPRKAFILMAELYPLMQEIGRLAK